MRKIASLWMACAALACAPAMAQQKDCGPADKAVDRVVNYPGLYKAFKEYGHCDKGPVEEVFTDAILRLMVEWKDVDTVAADAQRDPEYKKFLHKHLRTAVKEDRESVYSRAKSSCPVTQGPFCAELVEVVKAGGPAKDDLLAPLPTVGSPKK